MAAQRSTAPLGFHVPTTMRAAVTGGRRLRFPGPCRRAVRRHGPPSNRFKAPTRFPPPASRASVASGWEVLCSERQSQAAGSCGPRPAAHLPGGWHTHHLCRLGSYRGAIVHSCSPPMVAHLVGFGFQSISRLGVGPSVLPLVDSGVGSPRVLLPGLGSYT